ncbi:MAG: hypothetical protein NC429_12955 [Lachnospiraceae bacterium]|nr:hypothetical protein [Lachnospiraceae bacterium]
MIDFTKREHLKRGYAGANGNKISVRYKGEDSGNKSELSENRSIQVG